MSQARLYFTNKSIKEFTCNACGEVIPKGSRVIKFAVGYRGHEQKRHDTPECRPTRAQRESTNLAVVYEAIDGADIDGCESLEDLEAIKEEIVNACSEVADEYEGNQMYEVNYELQERAEMIRSAGDNLDGWSPDGDEPGDDDECGDCEGTGSVEVEDPAWDDNRMKEIDCDTCNGDGTLPRDQEAYNDWLNEQKESLKQAIDDMELP